MRNKCDNYIHNALSDELIIGYFPYCNKGYWEGDDLLNNKDEYYSIWDNCNDFN